jgi:hypothetical protein
VRCEDLVKLGMVILIERNLEFTEKLLPLYYIVKHKAHTQWSINRHISIICSLS